MLPPLVSVLRRSSLARAASWHRRLLAAAAAALAVAFALDAVEPPAAPTDPVVVAAVDLLAGTQLSADDVRVTGLPPPAVPSGALGDPSLVVGRTLAAPVRSGEPLTDVRLVGPGLVGAYGPGLVAAPVRLADAGVTRLLRTGDLVDVLAAPVSDPSGLQPAAGPATEVVGEVRVVLVEAPSETAVALEAGGLVVLATTPAQAADLAGAAAGAALTVRIRSG